jgi:hypothetical protein
MCCGSEEKFAGARPLMSTRGYGAVVTCDSDESGLAIR